MISDMENSDTDSEDDLNEIEAMLYSQIHHSFDWSSDNEKKLPGAGMIKDRSKSAETLHISTQKDENCLRFDAHCTVNQCGEPMGILSVNKENVQCAANEDVIVLSSDDECEILDHCGIVSKYNYRGVNETSTTVDTVLNASVCKSKQSEISAIENGSVTGQKSSTSCVANLYMHLVGDVTRNVTEEINVGSDSDVVSISSSDENVTSDRKRKWNESSTTSRKRQNTANVSFRHPMEDEDGITEIPVPVRKGNDWFICDGDRFPKRPDRRSDFHQRKLFIICHNCNRRGHITKTCPEPMKSIHCYICGDAGHHGDRCYRATCSVCWETGHSSISCHQRKKIPYTKCSMCQVPGHNEQHCPDTWRRFHLTIEPGDLVAATSALKSRKSISCCNCGGKGHFVHECTRKRMDVFILPNRPDVVTYTELLPTPSRSQISTQTGSSSKSFGKFKMWKKNFKEETRQTFSSAKEKLGKHIRFRNNWTKFNKRKLVLEGSHHTQQANTFVTNGKKKRKFWNKFTRNNANWRNSKRSMEAIN